MAAANASPRGQRTAILASPLGELTGFALAVDCLSPKCGGERTYSVTALAACYSASMTVSDDYALCDVHAAVAGMSPQRGGDRASTEPADQAATGGVDWTGGEGVIDG